MLLILLLKMLHACHRNKMLLAHFSVSAPLCQKIKTQSIVCLSLPAFSVLLGLALSPASDELAGSGTARF